MSPSLIEIGLLTKIRSQYDKHFRDDDIRNAALDAVIDILDKIRKIPDNAMAYVEKKYYNNFFERYIYY